MSLHAIFGKYAGQEVKVVGNQPRPQAHWDREDYMDIKHPQLDLSNTRVLSDMMKTAHDNGLNLVLTYSAAYYQDYQMNRVTAFIEQGRDGKWRVRDDFQLG